MSALTREEHQLVLKVLNAEQLAAYSRDMAIYADRIRDAKAALDQKRITQAAYEKTLELNGRRMRVTSEAIETLNKQTRNYQQNLIGLGYALNDFTSVQGGFQQQMIAVANNMPMLLAGFGGLGLALGAILPVLPPLVSGAKAFVGALGGEDAEKAKAALDAIATKLDERKKQLEALDKIKGGPGAEAKARAEQLQGDVGGTQDQIVQGLVEATPRAGLDALAAERQRQVDRYQALDRKVQAGAAGLIPHRDAARDEIAKLDQRINTQVATRQLDAKETVAKAMLEGDPQAVGKVVKAMRDRPEGFSPQQIGAFEAATPEAMAEQERIDAELERSIERQKEGRAKIAEKERALDAKRRLDDNNFEEAKKRADARAELHDARAAAIAANTPIDEMAVRYAQEARARGGDFDPRTGRKTGRNPTDALALDSARMAKRADPSLDDEGAKAIGYRIANQAFETVDRSIEERKQMTTFVGEAQQTMAVLAGEIQALHAMFGPAAAAQIRLKQQLIQSLQAQRARTHTMLPENH